MGEQTFQFETLFGRRGAPPLSEPAITFSACGISLNRVAVEKLRSSEHVVFRLDRKAKVLGVFPCIPQEFGARKLPVQSRAWTVQSLNIRTELGLPTDTSTRLFATPYENGLIVSLPGEAVRDDR
jgi:hypothetical protein